MPIRPENRALYPDRDAWRNIRNHILDRCSQPDGIERCEQCGKPNHESVLCRRLQPLGSWSWYDVTTSNWRDDHGRPTGNPFTVERSTVKKTRVVLTIAHLDHDPTHNTPENLRAWCQACHLAHDTEQHRSTRARTRDLRAGQRRLFQNGGN